MPFRAARPTEIPVGKEKRAMAFNESAWLSSVGSKTA
jgi:hypothetical protein